MLAEWAHPVPIDSTPIALGPLSQFHTSTNSRNLKCITTCNLTNSIRPKFPRSTTTPCRRKTAKTRRQDANLRRLLLRRENLPWQGTRFLRGKSLVVAERTCPSTDALGLPHVPVRIRVSKEGDMLSCYVDARARWTRERVFGVGKEFAWEWQTVSTMGLG